MKTPQNLAVKLRPAAEKAVKQGHPWVFSKGIAKLSPEGTAGDLAIIFDQDTNQVLALGLYDPGSPIRIKIIHNDGSEKIDSDFFKAKLEAAFELRQPLLNKDTNAYRLIFGENDGFPGLVVDIYNKIGVVKLYSAIWLPYIKLIAPHIAAITKVDGLVVRLSRKLQKKDFPLQEGDLLYGQLKQPEVKFKEHGIHFQTNVLLGHKTGFFLDHRANRQKIRQLAKNKTVLDVFSYAGGFSVYALAGGAQEATSIDISEQALELAVANVKLNKHSGKHQTLAGDAFKVLESLIQQGKAYDIVVIDPPSFAKSQKEIAVAKDKYAALATMGVKLTKKGGLLVLSSCSSRVSEDDLKQVHKYEFTRLGTRYELEDFTTHDLDHPVSFPEGAYLKTAYYRIK